ncbi:S1 RNA-binding domain-containing protein [Luteolibacter algae]|uniref:S1 RNA-binding domain-containing protein n=1 Tax=Luteolibacter algae TaxID=454151 RepID=A0ABW5D9L8_9BACT
MIEIGQRASLTILREKPVGLFLDAENLGEILLPRREMPKEWLLGTTLDVFIYLDSEDRLVATLKQPRAMPGEFAKLKCIALTEVGAFLEWGLPKDLLVPFREQKMRMETGKSYLVKILLDESSRRLMATTRIARHIDITPAIYESGEAVDLIVYGKTPMGYKAIVNNAHTGLIFANEVFQELALGEKLKGYIAAVRGDGKLDLTLHPPGRERVDDLEKQIMGELVARGGYWAISDKSPAEEIYAELGVSKRTFKQTVGALLKKRLVTLTDAGIRLN